MAPSISRPTPSASKYASVLLFVLAAFLFAAGTDPAPEIDFRVVPVSAPALKFTGGTGSAGGVGGPGTDVAQHVIAVTIIDPQSANCAKTERYANVQLSNVGSSSLLLPWNPDGARVVVGQEGSDQQIPFDSLRVTLRSKEKSDVFVTRVLFAGRSFVGSQVTLLPGHSVFLRNIALQSPSGSLCGADVIAEVALSTHRAVKSREGYSLISQEQWRAQSQ